MKRLRLDTQPDGSRKSKTMQGAYELVRAQTFGLEWRIYGVGNKLIHSGRAEDERSMREVVKKLLKQLGVAFYDELRGDTYMKEEE